MKKVMMTALCTVMPGWPTRFLQISAYIQRHSAEIKISDFLLLNRGHRVRGRMQRQQAKFTPNGSDNASLPTQACVGRELELHLLVYKGMQHDARNANRACLSEHFALSGGEKPLCRRAAHNGAVSRAQTLLWVEL